MFPVIIAGTLAAAAAYTYFGKNLVTSKEANKLIRTGKIKKVIDVRTIAEYRAGHYKGAVHIPVNKINKKTTTELPKKGLLVYCNTGQRARYAAEKLEALGFEDVYYIAGHYSTLN
jgi:phage shock protein E